MSAVEDGQGQQTKGSSNTAQNETGAPQISEKIIQAEQQQKCGSPQVCSGAKAVASQNCQYISAFQPFEDKSQQTEPCDSNSERKVLCEQFQQWLKRARSISEQLFTENKNLKKELENTRTRLTQVQQSDDTGHELIREFIEKQKANQQLITQQQAELEQLKQQIASKDEIENSARLAYEEKLESKNLEVQALQKQVARLEKEKSETDQKLQEQRVFMQRLNKAQKQSQQSAADSEASLKAMTELYQQSHEKVQSLQNLTQKLNQHQTQLQDTVATLKQQLADATGSQRIDQQQAQNIQQILSENEKLLVQVAKLKQQNTRLSETNKLLQEQNSIYSRQNEALDGSLAKQSGDLRELQQQINKIQAGAQNKSQEVRDSETVPQKGRTNQESHLAQQKDNEKQTQSLHQQIQSYKLTIEQQQKQLDDMSTVKNSWQEQINNYQAQEKKQLEENESMKRAIQELQTKLDQYETREQFYSESKVKQLSELRQNISIQNKQLHAQNSSLEQQIKALQTANEQLNQKLKQCELKLEVRNKKLEVSSVQQFSELKANYQRRTGPKTNISDVDQALKAKQQLQKALLQIQSLQSQLELSDRQRTLDHQQYSTEIDQKDAEIDELNQQLSQYYKQHYNELQNHLATTKLNQELERQILLLKHQLEKIDWYEYAKSLEDMLKKEQHKSQHEQSMNQLLREQYEQKQVDQEDLIAQLKTDYNLIRIRLNTLTPKIDETRVQKIQDQRVTVAELIKINEQQSQQLAKLNQKVEELQARCNRQPLKQSTLFSSQTGRKSMDFTQVISADKCKLFDTIIEILTDLVRECEARNLQYVQSKFDISMIDQMIQSLENELFLQKYPKPDDGVTKKGIRVLRDCLMLDRYERGLQTKRVVSRIPQIVLENEQMTVVTSGGV